MHNKRFFYSPQHALSPPADRPSGGKTISPLNSFPPLLSLILGGGGRGRGKPPLGDSSLLWSDSSSRFLTSEGGDHMSSLSCMYVLALAPFRAGLRRKEEEEEDEESPSLPPPHVLSLCMPATEEEEGPPPRPSLAAWGLSVRPKATGMKFDVLRCPPNSFPHTGKFFLMCKRCFGIFVKHFPVGKVFPGKYKRAGGLRTEG